MSAPIYRTSVDLINKRKFKAWISGRYNPHMSKLHIEEDSEPHSTQVGMQFKMITIAWMIDAHFHGYTTKLDRPEEWRIIKQILDDYYKEVGHFIKQSTELQQFMEKATPFHAVVSEMVRKQAVKHARLTGKPVQRKSVFTQAKERE